MTLSETRQILALDDDALEELIKKWIVRLIRHSDEYVGFDRPTASADEGRDAVGFLTERRYEGPWDNYQCKHLKRALGLSTFLVELGKMFHYASQGVFTLPRRYFFVAPNAAVRDVSRAVDMPSTIGRMLVEQWDAHCLRGITKAGAPLTEAIREAIAAYKFENVHLWKVTDIIEQPHMRGVMCEHLDIDPGAAPSLREEDIPLTPGDDERGYIAQLIKVYGGHRGQQFEDHDAVLADPAYSPQITRARRQFLDRKAFRLHFRDNLDGAVLDRVDQDVFDGVYDCYLGHGEGSKYRRLLGVIERAAGVEVSGPLGKHRRVTPSVKQGVCHYHAGDGKMLLQWDR